MVEREQLISLVRGLQNGEPEAAGQLFETFQSDIYYFILKTVNNDRDLAEDLTQDTFVTILEKIHDLQEPAAFVTWSKQIAYSKCTGFFKKHKELLADEDEDGYSVFDTLEEENEEFIPGAALDKEDLRKAVIAMINELPEEQKSAILLRYFNEISVKDIAQIQGVSEGTVKSRLNYARKAIKQSVEEYEKKNDIKLHCAGIIPLLLWLFKNYRLGKGLSLTRDTASAVFIIAEEGSKAAAVAVTATGAAAAATAGSTAAASTAAATVTAVAAKTAGTALGLKIAAGITAAAVALGGTAIGAKIYSDAKAPTTIPAIITTAPTVTTIWNTQPTTTGPLFSQPATTAPSVPATSVPETSVPETSIPETSVPETSVPETTVPETTVPETSVPETTVPETTVPETTVPETSVPETTVPETTTTVPEATEPDSSNEATGLSMTLNAGSSGYIVSGIGTCTDTELVIPETYEGLPVVGIADSAFSSNSTITTVYMPDSITTIGSNAFNSCSALQTVYVSAAVTEIPDNAFAYCRNLSDVFLPDGLVTINYYAFSGCYALKSLDIPDSVTTIMDWAFSDCSSLRSINLSANVTTIGSQVWMYCGALETITVESGNPNYHSNGNCLIKTANNTLMFGSSNSVIPSDGSVTTISDHAFSYNANLTRITIPVSVTYIGWASFEYCTNLTEIEFLGTIEQWNAITKDTDWDNGSGNYTVHCTDGDIAK